MLPESLLSFLRLIFSEKDADVKIAAIGQALIQACRPKSFIAPLQLGLGVQMHHQFGSRFLIDTLNNLGFSVSYKEVQKFERNAAAANSTSIPDYFPGKFVQFVADNVDHNIRTLDGHNTFHGMGIIACTTPASNVEIVTPRCNIKANDLAEVGKIDIRYFRSCEEGTPSFKFMDIKGPLSDPSCKIDLFSKAVWTVRPSRPAWSGFMQSFQTGSYSGRSNVSFLPMIDMNPSDMSCLNTTLWFVCKQAERYGFTPVITFDQPLFFKATSIMNNQGGSSPLKRIVLRLGGFHTLMSFLGSVGHVMMGSGLKELLETVYAPNAVIHMLTGKSVARATRAHFLVDTVLHALLLSKTFATTALELPVYQCVVRKGDQNDHGNNEQTAVCSGNSIYDSTETFCDISPCMETKPNIDENLNLPEGKSSILKSIGTLFDALENGEVSLQEVCTTDTLSEVEKGLSSTRQKLASNRTASLWFQYMDMVAIIQRFLRAERTGDLDQHLNTVRCMLPYFAASGHSLYLKSAYIYLQNMLTLQTDHPEVYEAFKCGNHVVRRSDRFWAGLSTDLVIEQVLMRSVKTTGGLTRGRGMSDIQRAQWLLSMPACSHINSSMQAVTKVNFETSEQHKELGKTRKSRDSKDALTFLSFLTERDPFDEDECSLINIDTGVTAESSVNADKAHEIGSKILEDMSGKEMAAYTFRKSKMVTFDTKSAIKLNDEVIQVDPQLLFQRLTTAAHRNIPEISEIFQYELCSIPSSLFDKTGLPRPAQKSVLADAIWSLGECGIIQIPSHVKYVLDGGSLLQRIPWQKNTTFASICNQYVDCIQQKYTNATIVFDGYSSGASIKDITHIRRRKGHFGTKVKFNLETPFRTKKETFLSNEENKQNFINLLGQVLADRGIKVHHANDDADVLIVRTAITESIDQVTVVIGEDTDLLVLLCRHASLDSYDIYLKSDIRRSLHQTNKVWHIQKTKIVLGQEMCHSLPFLHALTGCDTTSHIYGVSKAACLQMFKKNKTFRKLSESFITESSRDSVVSSGEKAITLLCGGCEYEGLNLLRFRKFSNKVMTSQSYIQVHTLPPTSAAAVYHSLRVYLQTQIWLENNALVPQEWGWQLVDGKLSPVKTHLLPAPEKLLKIIRCNCICDTKRCTCRRHGLDCSPGCGACHGNSCSNSPPNDDDVEEQAAEEEVLG